MSQCKIEKILQSTAKHHEESLETSEFVAGLSPEAKRVYIMAEQAAHDSAVDTFTSAMRESLCPGCCIKSCAA